MRGGPDSLKICSDFRSVGEREVAEKGSCVSERVSGSDRTFFFFFGKKPLTFVCRAVSEQRNSTEVTPFKFIRGQALDDATIDRRAVVEVTVAIEPGLVSQDVG